MIRGALCTSCGVGVLVELDDGAMECSNEACGVVIPAAQDRIKSQIEIARERIQRAAETKPDVRP